MNDNQNFGADLDKALGDLANPPGTTEPTEVDKPEPTEVTPDPAAEAGKATEVTKDDPANPMRQLREEYKTVKNESLQTKAELAKYQTILEKVARSQNISVEELENKLQEKEDSDAAKLKGISPEFQKQIREQEQRIAQLETENKRTLFNYKAQSFVAKNKLNNESFLDFANQAKTAGFDIVNNPNVDFDAVYRALNYDSMVGSLREQIRQEVLLEIKNNQNTSPTPNAGRAGANPNARTDDPFKSDADFLTAVTNQFKK